MTTIERCTHELSDVEETCPICRDRLETWKDGEYLYCRDLVNKGGDRNVPAGVIRSYLAVQIASAKRDGNGIAVAALQKLLLGAL